MLERYLLAWLLAICGVAYFWPSLMGQAFDPFVGGKTLIPWLIALTMFSVGVMMPRDEVRQVRERWPQVLFGTAVQYSAMPLLGWGVARLSGLNEDYQIGMIMVGCVPGAMASNVITMNSRGHTSYSVSLTTASTMLSPIVVPLTLGATLGRDIAIDKLTVSRDLLLQVVLPVLVGFASVRIWPKWEKIGNRVGPLVANLVILWIIATVVALNRQQLAAGSWELIVPLLAINLLGYVAGYSAGTAIKQPESMRRALTIEVGMQNAGLGTSLALLYFNDRPAATVPTALYTFGCVLTATLLARFWAARAPKD
ncbi:MAG: bile acid:sodium symporter family protein [Pirellulales bacterium]